MASNEIDQLIRGKRLYFIGERLPSDWYEAFRLWLPIAENGDAKAQYNVGRCYDNGDGVDKDKNKAQEWYLKAADQGEPRAHHNIALKYKDSNDRVQANEWFSKAAALGEPRSLYALGINSIGTGDKERAKEFFQQSADLGWEWGQIGLVACNLQLTYSQGSKTNYYSFNAAVVNGNGGGTQTGTYNSPTIILKVKNNSTMPAIVSLWLETFDFQNPNLRIGGEVEVQLPLLQPNQEAEVEKEVFQAEKERKSIYVVGYSVSNGQLKDYFELPNKLLVWEWSPKKSGCFVLTACYEDFDAPTVFAFRQFRDNVMQNYWLGRKFISWYYSFGPKLANFISDKPKAKSVLRSIFNQMVKILPK